MSVCRHPRSVPLDVPTTTGSTNIPNGDSGFLYEQSGSSLSSGPQSAPIFHTLQNSKTDVFLYFILANVFIQQRFLVEVCTRDG